MPHVKPLKDVLLESARPVFLFGSTPPKEGTSIDEGKETCKKFAMRSAVLATDGFIVYDIQDEGKRTTLDRPFPFRKTMDPALYASFFPSISGKDCIVYKHVSESETKDYDNWLDNACGNLHHTCFTLVGAASSSEQHKSIGILGAATRTNLRQNVAFGCVCIPERHMIKKNEDVNMFSKATLGAQWFITQGIFDAEHAIKTINDYSKLCRDKNVVPKKVILTFAPCGRQKTMTFIKWLGMHVPESVEKSILESTDPVHTSITILNDILKKILEHTGGSGVPLGLNVESLSIFKEEINGAHELFQILQTTLLNGHGSPWAIRWLYVRNPSSPRPYYSDSRPDSREGSTKGGKNYIAIGDSESTLKVNTTAINSNNLMMVTLAFVLGMVLGGKVLPR